MMLLLMCPSRLSPAISSTHSSRRLSTQFTADAGVHSSPCQFLAMAPAATAFNSVLLAAYVVVVALLSAPAATRVSAQGLAMAPSPAISLDTGAAPSLGVSGAAAILCSFLLATLHLFFGN